MGQDEIGSISLLAKLIRHGSRGFAAQDLRFSFQGQWMGSHAIATAYLVGVKGYSCRDLGLRARRADGCDLIPAGLQLGDEVLELARESLVDQKLLLERPG